jgi:hypothetical protein
VIAYLSAQRLFPWLKTNAAGYLLALYPLSILNDNLLLTDRL